MTTPGSPERTALDARIAALSAVRQPEPAQVEAFAARKFSVEVDEGAVTVTITGAGEILALDVMVSATRGDAQELLGDRVVRAVNAAFAEVTRARSEEFGIGADPAASIEEKVEAFTSRMDSITSQMDSTRTSILDQTRQISELRAQF